MQQKLRRRLDPSFQKEKNNGRDKKFTPFGTLPPEVRGAMKTHSCFYFCQASVFQEIRICGLKHGARGIRTPGLSLPDGGFYHCTR
jgi:hypothetical protein